MKLEEAGLQAIVLAGTANQGLAPDLGPEAEKGTREIAVEIERITREIETEEMIIIGKEQGAEVGVGTDMLEIGIKNLLFRGLVSLKKMTNPLVALYPKSRQGQILALITFCRIF